jgi:uncharacterized membrane protein YdjX (TVP38/TMEM64 family)
VRKLNPIWLLVAFNVLFFAGRGWLVPDEAIARFSTATETFLLGLGPLGYAGMIGTYTLCAFFFIPLLIPLNILCGAVYGPYVGTAVSITGITLGTYASTLSVRHVFRGMERTIDERPSAQKILRQVERHGAIVVILVRLAFVVPYLLQNIVLAVTRIGIHRLAALTAIGALPAAAIYSFLGAGLMQSESAAELALYLAVPLVLLTGISLLIRRLNRKYAP